jgi:hypothetical protein
MALLATILAIVALAGAIASWGMGAWFYARARRREAAGDARPTGRDLVIALVTWPFARGALAGAAAAERDKINKALVAFFACLMLAVAATSVATNLARVSRQAVNG